MIKFALVILTILFGLYFLFSATFFSQFPQYASLFLNPVMGLIDSFGRVYAGLGLLALAWFATR